MARRKTWPGGVTGRRGSEGVAGRRCQNEALQHSVDSEMSLSALCCVFTADCSQNLYRFAPPDVRTKLLKAIVLAVSNRGVTGYVLVTREQTSSEESQEKPGKKTKAERTTLVDSEASLFAPYLVRVSIESDRLLPSIFTGHGGLDSRNRQTACGACAPDGGNTSPLFRDRLGAKGSDKLGEQVKKSSQAGHSIAHSRTTH